MATEMDRAYCDWPQHDEISSQNSCEETSISQLLDHGSISFGRFAVETLSWEKWSVFTHNRCKEELEQFKAPGLVAQKKAYFEEYYRKIRALKALQSHEERPMVDSGNDSSVSSQNAEDTHDTIPRLQNSTNGEKDRLVQSMENKSVANQVTDEIPVTQGLGNPCPDYSTRSSSNHRPEEGSTQVYDNLNSGTVTSSDVTSPGRSCSNDTVAQISQQKHDNMGVEMKDVPPMAKEPLELCHAEVDILQKHSSRSVNDEPDSKKKEHRSSLQKKEHPTHSVRSSPGLFPKSKADTIKSSQRPKYSVHNELVKNEYGSNLSKTGRGRISSSRKPASVSSDKPVQDIAATLIGNNVKPNVNLKSNEIRPWQKTKYPLPGTTSKIKQINITDNSMSTASASSHGKRSTATQSVNSRTKSKSLATNNNSVSTVLSSRSTIKLQTGASTTHLFPVSTQRHVSSRDNGVLASTKTNGSTRIFRSSTTSLSSTQSASARIAVTGGITDTTVGARRIKNEVAKKMAIPDSSRAMHKLHNTEGSGLKAMPSIIIARSVSNQKMRLTSHVRSYDGRVQKEGLGEAQLRKNQGTAGFAISSQAQPSYAGPKYSSKRILVSQPADLSGNGRKPWG